ncbi:MAG: hypothetical protein H3C27_03370 [Opitutaceae bacterium]|nr:hypothetical protein [Opitutaceae bacterium]
MNNLKYARGPREKILACLGARDFRALFMEGGCQFYALVLNEQLGLPLFYAAPPHRDSQSHVFAMKGDTCLDYDGKKPIAEVAKRYSGWADESPRPVTPEQVRDDLKRRGIDDLEEIVLPVARDEFECRRTIYD